MKTLTVFLFTALLIACKTEPKKEASEKMIQTEMMEEKISYPESLINVFDAHGGLKAWKSMRTLSYEMPKKEWTETHTIDLWSRKDKVETDAFSMGFDGKDVWLFNPDEVYKSDAAFYHNLMVYFYAMPFILSDDGIIYSETEPLVFEGNSYPGIRISYETGVGVSSKDEYFIHYDPETYKMTWLGYTVTYRTGEISDTVKWIRYDDWQSVEGLILPNSITWYNFEGRTILDARNKVPFENVTLSSEPKPEGFYAKPEEAEFVAVKKS